MGTDAAPNFASLNESLLTLQYSSRRTIPVFVLGIFATLIAAGAAVYYIVNLSAEVRSSHRALAQAKAQIVAINGELSNAKAQLGANAKTANTPAEARAFNTAIAHISATQANVSSATTVISKAAARLDATDPSVRQTDSTAPVTSTPDHITPQNRPELTGKFVIVPTPDHFAALRDQPSMAGALIAKLPTGSVLKCAQAAPNDSGTFWRPCTDDLGNVGYVANRLVAQPQ